MDPYAPLDPHSTGSLAIKPLIVSKRHIRRKRPKPPSLDVTLLPSGAVPPPSANGVTFPEFAQAYQVYNILLCTCCRAT